MNNTELAITIGYSILAIIGVIVLLSVFRSTRVGFRVQTANREKLERREGYWGVAVVAFLVIVLGGTIIQIPYWHDKSKKPVPQTVHVVGRQFAWTISPPRVRVNEKTRFRLRSADVSHGFAIYDPDNVMLKQVNIGPGVQQDFVLTFSKPGSYKILCLEFCGVDHHLMQAKLEVTP